MSTTQDVANHKTLFNIEIFRTRCMSANGKSYHTLFRRDGGIHIFLSKYFALPLPLNFLFIFPEDFVGVFFFHFQIKIR